MIFQEKQHTFSGVLSHYTVTLAMREKQLTINVHDDENLHKFHGNINQDFIECQDKYFVSHFECPEDVFDHLTKHFKEIIIENEIFQFSYRSGQKQRNRIVVVVLKKQEVDSLVLAHKKFGKMNDHFTIQLQQRDNKILDLANEQRESANKFEDYKKQNQEKMGIIEEKMQKEQHCRIQLEEKIQKEQICIKELTEKFQEEQNFKNQLREKQKNQQKFMRRLEKKLQMQELQLKHLKETFLKQQKYTINTDQNLKNERLRRKQDVEQLLIYCNELQLQNKSIKNRQQKQEIYIKMLEDTIKKKNSKTIKELLNSIPKPISHHPNNAHEQYYTLTNCTATSAKLTRVGGGNNCYNFVNRTSVLPDLHNKYAVRILKAKDNCLLIGFCTEKGLRIISNYKYDESVYYYCNSEGYLWENGVRKELSGCGSADGDVVEVVLDLLEWQVGWGKGGKLLAECAVPESMKGKHIYFSIIQYYEEDEVEVASV